MQEGFDSPLKSRAGWGAEKSPDWQEAGRRLPTEIGSVPNHRGGFAPLKN